MTRHVSFFSACAIIWSLAIQPLGLNVTVVLPIYTGMGLRVVAYDNFFTEGCKV
jgi:hypothetical protein